MKYVFQLNVRKNGIFNEKFVAYEEDFLVQIYHSYRDLQFTLNHNIWLSLSGIAFKYCNNFAPYLLRNFNVLDYYLSVLDLVAVNHPLVVRSCILHECGIESPSNLCTLDISCCETFFVLGDGVKKKILIPWVKVIQTNLMHFEFHLGFSLQILYV